LAQGTRPEAPGRLPVVLAGPLWPLDGAMAALLPPASPADGAGRRRWRRQETSRQRRARRARADHRVFKRLIDATAAVAAHHGRPGRLCSALRAYLLNAPDVGDQDEDYDPYLPELDIIDYEHALAAVSPLTPQVPPYADQPRPKKGRRKKKPAKDRDADDDDILLNAAVAEADADRRVEEQTAESRVSSLEVILRRVGLECNQGHTMSAPYPDEANEAVRVCCKCGAASTPWMPYAWCGICVCAACASCASSYAGGNRTTALEHSPEHEKVLQAID